MVEIVVKLTGEGPYGKAKMEELVYDGAQHRKRFFRGDVVKCVSKGWAKHMKIPDEWGVLRIPWLTWVHDRMMLLEPLLGGEDGETRVGRRRFYVDVDSIKGFRTRRVVTLWRKRKFLVDKEGK